MTSTNFYYNTTINGSATAGALSCSSLTNTGTLSSTSAATMGALSCSSVSSLGAISSSGTFSCGANAATMGALSCSTIATSSGIVCGALTSSGQLVCGSITSSGIISCGTSSATVGALSCSTISASGDIIIHKDNSVSLVFKSSSNSSVEYGLVGHVGYPGDLMADALPNDMCIRNTSSGNKILLGIGSSRATAVIDDSYLRLNRLGDIPNAGLFDFRNTDGWGIYCTTTNEASHGNSLDFKSNDYNFNSSRYGTALSLSATGRVGINTSYGAFSADVLNINGNIYAQTSFAESVTIPARFFNTSGNNIYMAMGVKESLNTCLYMSFVSNYTTPQDSIGRLGFWGDDNIITWGSSGGIGRVGINKAPDTNTTYALDVSGDCRISSIFYTFGINAGCGNFASPYPLAGLQAQGLHLSWCYDGALNGTGYIINTRGTGTGGIRFGSYHSDDPPSGPWTYYEQFVIGGVNDANYQSIYMPLIRNLAGSYPLKWTAGGEITYDGTSSRRFKKDISPFVDDGLLYRLNPVNYRYINDPDVPRIGLIAEDVAPLDPERRYVIYDKEDLPEGIAYDKFITPIIACVQSQNKQIKDLQAEIAVLKQEIAALK